MPGGTEPKPDKRPDKSRSGCAGLVAVVLVIILPVLYVLSVGPGWWLNANSIVSDDVFEFVYAPLGWVCKRNPMIDNAIQAYCDWWAVL